MHPSGVTYPQLILFSVLSSIRLHLAQGACSDAEAIPYAVNVGESLTLPCPDNEFEIIWTFGKSKTGDYVGLTKKLSGNVLISNGSGGWKRDDSSKAAQFSFITGQNSLKLSQPKTGYYCCEYTDADTFNKEHMNYAVLVVDTPPEIQYEGDTGAEITTASSPETFNVSSREGVSVNLKCAAEELPEHNAQTLWKSVKDKRLVSEDTLWSHALTPQDNEARFYCEKSFWRQNVNGKAIVSRSSNEVMFRVEYSAFYVEDGLPDFRVVEEKMGEVVFRCTVQANPRVEYSTADGVHWEFIAAPEQSESCEVQEVTEEVLNVISQDDVTRINNTEVDQYTLKSSLTIKDAGSERTGCYICKFPHGEKFFHLKRNSTLEAIDMAARSMQGSMPAGLSVLMGVTVGGIVLSATAVAALLWVRARHRRRRYSVPAPALGTDC